MAVARTYEVLLHGQSVGQLVEDERAISFRFHDVYRELAYRPVLSQSFEDDLGRVYAGKRGKLPAFFDNLVPEGALREVLERVTGTAPGDDLALLEAAGDDLPGAVTIRPSDVPVHSPKLAPDIETYANSESDGKTNGLRFSLAGIQLKFSVIRAQDKLAIPAKGQYGDWIVKLDSQQYPYLVENEYATLQWARASGLEVPECYLQSTDELEGVPRDYATPGSVLVIRRYDRRGQERIHQEDMAQALRLFSDHKYDHVTYEQLGLFVRSVCGKAQYEDFVRRLTFMIASGNSDGHLKNWSLVYPDGIRAELAPLYDQVCTVAWSGTNPELRKSALKMGGAKDFSRIDTSVIRRFAKRSGADPESTLKRVEETLSCIVEAWKKNRTALPMPQSHASALRLHWQQTPLLSERAGEIGA